jgi:hypothetical protein
MGLGDEIYRQLLDNNPGPTKSQTVSLAPVTSHPSAEPSSSPEAEECESISSNRICTSEADQTEQNGCYLIINEVAAHNERYDVTQEILELKQVCPKGKHPKSNRLQSIEVVVINLVDKKVVTIIKLHS